MNNMKRIRFYRDLTQDELALQIGYSQSLISKLERDLLPFTPGIERMKERISQALGFPKERVFPEG